MSPRAALAYAGLVLRLNLRNPMAMIYGYLFPLVFLAAFAILYRHDAVPILAHLGELLTVTALGGACFGLPTAIVAERERGVWRRYRATPAGAGTFVAGLVLSRLVLLVSAAVLQIALAMLLLGMPLPAHPAGLLLAFLLVSLALIGLGMIVAMLAGSVPAVQALGQCIFLPMLMIGGVAVRLSSLPDWVQTLSAFFPGRYAVAAIQANATGRGVASVSFDLTALAVFALASALMAASLFRWDSARRRAHRPLLVAGLALWLAIGTAGATLGIERARPIVDETPVAPPEAFLRVPDRPSSIEPPAPARPQATPKASPRRPRPHRKSRSAGRMSTPKTWPASPSSACRTMTGSSRPWPRGARWTMPPSPRRSQRCVTRFPAGPRRRRPIPCSGCAISSPSSPCPICSRWIRWSGICPGWCSTGCGRMCRPPISPASCTGSPGIPWREMMRRSGSSKPSVCPPSLAPQRGCASGRCSMP